MLSHPAIHSALARAVDALGMLSTGVHNIVRTITTVQELLMDVLVALEINASMGTDQEDDVAGIASTTSISAMQLQTDAVFAMGQLVLDLTSVI